MAVANQLTPSLGASARGVVWGRGERIYLKLIIGWRKYLICKLHNFILVFIILPTLLLPKQWIYTHPMLPDSLASSPYSPPPRPPVSGWFLCVK